MKKLMAASAILFALGLVGGALFHLVLMPGDYAAMGR